MLRKFRGILIIWIVALFLLLVNFITNMSFSDEVVFAVINIVTLTMVSTITVKKILDV